MQNDAKISLGADVSNFEQGLKQATASLAKFQIGAGLVTSGLKTAFASLGVGLSVGGFVLIGKSAIDTADALKDMSTRLNISVHDLAGLKLIAEQSGTSLENVGGGVAKLTKNIGLAEAGNVEIAASLKNLGVSARDPKEAFFQLADSVKSSKDPFKLAADLSKVLGKSYTDLIPLLAEGGDGMRKSAQETETFADAMARLAPDADKFKDQLAALKLNSTGFAATLLIDVVPSLNETLKSMSALRAEGSPVLALLRGFAGIGKIPIDFAFPSLTPIQEAGNEVKRLQELVDGTRKKLTSGKAPIPFSFGLEVKFSEGTLDKLRKNLGEQEQLLKIAKERTDRLTANAAPKPRKAIADNAEQISCIASGGTWDGKKCTQKTASGPADDPAKKLLENSLKNYEFLVGQESEIFASRNKFLDLYNKENLISIKGYYDSRKAAQEENISNTLALYDKEIATLEAYSAKSAKATDRAEATGKINELIAKKTKLQQTAAEASIFASVEETRAFKDLQNQIAGVNAQVLEFTGNLHAAAVIRFDQQNEELRKRFSAEGNGAALEQLEFVKKFTLAQVDLNKITQDGALIKSAAANAETRISLAQKAGSLSEIESLQAISSIRVKEGEQLEALYLSYKKIADESGNPKLLQDADDMKVALESLRSESDLVGQKFNTLFKDSFSDAFADFLSGTKSASDAFKAFGNTVAAEISKMAAKQLAKDLFGGSGKGSDGGSGGWLQAAAALFGFADGGVMTSKGAMPLRSYAGGGIASSPQLAMFGEGATNEAFVPLPDGRSIPVKMQGKNSSSINITVNVQGGSAPDVRRAAGQGAREALAALSGAGRYG